MGFGEVVKDLYGKNQYSLEVFPGEPGGRFAVICPGGGYGAVCSFVEGRPYARKLNELGYTAVVLRYRTRKKARFPAPMEDLAKAVQYVLENAEALQVQTQGYSVWGSSAGGHLAASWGTATMGYLKYGLPKPAALVLCYPVITMGASTHQGSADNLLGKERTSTQVRATSIECQIDCDYPPSYVWACKNDTTVDCCNSTMLAARLEEKHIPYTLRLFDDGKHGCGLAEGTEAENWFREAVEFWHAQL